MNMENKFNIIQLNKGFKGPDQVNNIICLCPNHHSQFDGFGFYIDSETLEIKGLDGYEGKKLIVKDGHNIDKEAFYSEFVKHN